MPKVLYKSSEVDNSVKFEFVEIAKPVLNPWKLRRRKARFTT